jgi:hypothetical protein
LILVKESLAAPRYGSAMKHYDAAVWIDHASARVFSLNSEDADEWTIRPHERHTHIHHKAGSVGAGKAVTEIAFFEGIAEALQGAGAILLAGPGNAKSHFATWLRRKHPGLGERIAAVEPLDHPSDGQLLAFARKFFRAEDRMTPGT